MQKKVLILTPFFRPNIGGAETHLNDFCEYLRTHGFYVYVLTYQPLTTKLAGLSFEKKDNLEIRRLSWFGQNLFHKLEPYPFLEFLYLFPRLFMAVFLFMFRNHQKVNVIHAHGFIAAIVTRIVTLFYPKKTVMSLHAIYCFKKRKIMAEIAKWVLDGFDIVLALARFSKNDLIVAGVADRKIKIINQWVDQNVFSPKSKQQCRRQLGLKEDFFVLFVGRLIEKKGVSLLVKVAKDLPQVKFIFVGDGPMYQELKKKEKAPKNINVIGKKDQKQTALYYGASDIVVVPSQYEEGFARVVLEALSSSRPVVASNKGCLPEMITDQIGILVDPTKKNLKQAILSLYQDPQRLKDLTNNSRPYAEKNFSEKNAAQIAKLYLKN